MKLFKDNILVIFVTLAFVGLNAQTVEWTSSTEQAKWVRQKAISFQLSKPAKVSVPIPVPITVPSKPVVSVLLLNATLTVRAHQAGSHQNKGWEQFTDAVIHRLAEQKEHLVFVLWGSYAQRKGEFIDSSRHLVLRSVHPSPLSAHRGFFGNHHFSKANEYLVAHDKSAIDW
jgi:uracil-DNA glycosylase